MRVRTTTALFAAFAATAALAASDTHTYLTTLGATLSSALEVSTQSGQSALRFKTPSAAGAFNPGGWQSGTDWEGRLQKPTTGSLFTSAEQCLRTSSPNNPWATSGGEIVVNSGRTYTAGLTTVAVSGTSYVGAIPPNTNVAIPASLGAATTGIRFLTAGTHPGTNASPTALSYTVTFNYSDATSASSSAIPIALATVTTGRAAATSSPSGNWTTTPWTAIGLPGGGTTTYNIVNVGMCGNSGATGRDIVWVANPQPAKTVTSVSFAYTGYVAATTNFLGGPIALSVDTTESGYRTAFNFANEGTLTAAPTLTGALIAERSGHDAAAWWYGARITGVVSSPDGAELRYRCSHPDLPASETIPENKWYPWVTVAFTLTPNTPVTFGAYACRGIALQYELRLTRPQNGTPSVNSLEAFYDVDEDGDARTVQDLWNPTTSAASNGLEPDCDDLDAATGGPDPWYADDDGDTHGDPGDMVKFCPDDNTDGYVFEDLDCDDGNANVALVGVNWYPDADSDGLGATGPVVNDCPEPLPRGSYVLNNTDCNDTYAQVGTTPVSWYVDGDGDTLGAGAATVSCTPPVNGVLNQTDCNDADATIGANAVTWYSDADHDGLGGAAPTQLSCTQPVNYVRTSTDCNDTDATIGLAPGVSWYRDQDADNFGAAATTQTSCTQPVGYVRNNLDCDDNPTDDVAPRFAANKIYPGATIYVDIDGDGWGGAAAPASVLCRVPTSGQSVDNTDCDDNDASERPGVSWYRDADGDGFGATTATAAACARTLPSDVSNNTDCDDVASDNTIRNQAALIFPNARFYVDADGDQYGAGAGTVPTGCGLPSGHSVLSTDCDDNTSDDVTPRNQAALIFPGATLYTDVDSDGFGSSTQVAASTSCRIPTSTQSTVSTDCDDNDATEKPGVLWYRDADGDTYGATTAVATSCSRALSSDVTNNTDCDDDASDNTLRNQAALIFPGARYYTDTDGDQRGAGAGAVPGTCGLPSGSSVLATDCDDTNSAVFPGATYYIDNDGDTWGTSSVNNGGACPVPSGQTWRNGDCDDDASDDAGPRQLAARIFPGATFYADTDRDNYGDPATPVTLSTGTCRSPTAAESVDNTDCSPNNVLVYPGATYYRDLDGDGYGRTSSGTSQSPAQCVVPTGFVTSGADCDDADVEAVDTTRSWYRDDDKDTYGGVLWGVQCTRPTSGSGATLLRGVINNTDCDDTPNDDAPPRQVARLIFPGATLYQDGDQDGYGRTRAGNSAACRIPTTSQSVDNTDCDDADATERPNVTWYRDVDADGFGDPGTTASVCARSVASDAPNNTDCNDNPATDTIRSVANKIFPGATYYVDADADQYGSTSSVTPGTCGLPSGHSVRNDDCDDGDAAEKPGVSWYPDVDGDTFGDGSRPAALCARANATDRTSNTDCDDNPADDRLGAEAEKIFPGAQYWRDADRDGYGAGAAVASICALPSDGSTNNLDCDDDASDDTIRDQAARVFPGASYFIDQDSDGFGAGSPVLAAACALPRGQSVLGTDCVDDPAGDVLGAQAARIFPGATYYLDADEDRFGAAAAPITPATCGLPSGHVDNDDDCDDADDEARDLNTTRAWWEDRDGDGFGDPARTKNSCVRGGSWRTNSLDCDDDASDDAPAESAAMIFPGATYYADEDGDARGDAAKGDAPGCPLPDGYSVWSDDCDDADVEATHLPRQWYRDFDGDLFGAAAGAIQACVRPRDADNDNPYVTNFEDCRDDLASANPNGVEETGNDADDDCDGVTWCFRDDDKDGYGDFVITIRDRDGDGRCATTSEKEANDNNDCDDANPSTHPNIEEGRTFAGEIQGDGIDRDCSCIHPGDPDPRPELPISDFGFGCGLPDEDDDGDGLTWDEEQLCGASDADTDTDGDGVGDALECALGTLAFDADTDGDGVRDDLELGIDQENPRDFDGDGTWDVFDTDDDNDGLETSEELTSADPTATDRDDDAVSCPAAAGDFTWVPNDIFDGCGPDWLDIDDDNDQILTIREIGAAASLPDDGDGLPAWWDDDTDGDGFPDRDEGDVQTDGDGLPDFIDPDSDDDRVPDANERHEDTDNDDLDDRVDTDDDGDRVATASEVALVDGLPSPTASPLDLDSDVDDTPDFLDRDDDGDSLRTRDEDNNGDGNWFNDDFDGDGLPDFRDDDDDDDQIATAIEAARAAADDDGAANWLDEDADDDGWTDLEETNADTDGDTIPDWADLDSDADSIDDIDEEHQPTDDDDLSNRVDDDDDGDGIPTLREADLNDADLCVGTNVDIICDNIPNYLDRDSDGDTWDDAVEGDVNSDTDAFPDFLDADSDNDVWPDALELDANTDGDALSDRVDADDDGDTVPTREEIDRGDIEALDTDGDDVPDHLDADDDGDTVPTLYEVQQDVTNIGMYLNIDSDADSITDGVEWGQDFASPRNTDNDSLIDARDPDDDGDGIPTNIEGTANQDGPETQCGQRGQSDLVPAYLDLDSDGDGIPDGTALPKDALNFDGDGDDVPDYVDCNQTGCAGDDDADNLANCDESTLGTNPLSRDTDGDGVDDFTEVGGSVASPKNTDGDAQIDALDVDDDGDGFPTRRETASCLNGLQPLADASCRDGSTPSFLLPPNPERQSDQFTGGALPRTPDNIPDRLDADDDGDGRLSVDEGEADDDSDAIPNYLDQNDADGPSGDADGDGLTNAVEAEFGLNPLSDDTDGDGLPDGQELNEGADLDGDDVIDALDPDDDGDGLSTLEEGAADPDNDGTPAWADTDADGDGRADLSETGDADCDGIPDAEDMFDADGPCLAPEDPAPEKPAPPPVACGCSSATGSLPLAPVLLLALSLRRQRRRAA
jgi:hypothetical protein